MVAGGMLPREGDHPNEHHRLKGSRVADYSNSECGVGGLTPSLS